MNPYCIIGIIIVLAIVFLMFCVRLASSWNMDKDFNQIEREREMEYMERRDKKEGVIGARLGLAIETAEKIVRNPSYPFDSPYPRAMITAIDQALETWENRNK